MNEESRARIDLVVQLNGALVCVMRIEELPSAIKKTEALAHAPVSEEFHKWPVNVEHHSSHKGVTDVDEPLGLKVWHAARKDASKSLF